MKYLITLAAIFFYCNNSFSVVDIISGDYISLDQQPWFARSKNHCGMVIISPRHLLTAAHCIEKEGSGKYDEVFQILGGGNGLFEDMRVLGHAVKWHSHPDYRTDQSESLWFNDIAIIVLEKEIKFSRSVQPIKIAKPGTVKHKDLVYLAGMAMYPKTIPLKEVSAMVMPVATNKKFWTQKIIDLYPEFSEEVVKNRVHSAIKQFQDKVLITEGEHGGAEPGDSGGPVVLKRHGLPSLLVGIIVSITRYPRDKRRLFNHHVIPGAHLKWIKSIIGKRYSRDYQNIK